MRLSKKDYTIVCNLLDVLDSNTLQRQELIDKAWELERESMNVRNEVRRLLHCAKP